MKWIKKIIGGVSFTSALFVFQACYGSPQDFGLDVLIEGQVKSGTSDLSIKGIKVSVADRAQYDYTDENGNFSFYTAIVDNLKITFEDVDSIQNGLYVDKDTMLTGTPDVVHLDIVLEEK
jgi:hypothetical protein